MSMPDYIDNINETPATQTVTEAPNVVTETPETATNPANSATEGGESEQREQQQQEGTEKKPNGVQSRIDELTRKRGEAEREADYWKRIAQAQGKPSAEQQAPAAPAKPEPGQFDNYGDYIEALTDWKSEQKSQEAIRKAFEERDQQRQQQQQAEQRNQVASTFAERATAFREVTPDFNDVIAAAGDIVVPDAIQDVILGSEHGPRIVYELAKDRAEAERIMSLPPMQAALAIGRLEAKFSTSAAPAAPAAPTKPAVTKAPAPITPNRSSGGQFTKDPDQMTDAEWLEAQRTRK